MIVTGAHKILYIGESHYWEIISTLLVGMGCTCFMASSKEALAVLEREAFDAVLLSWDSSCTEELVERLQKVRPGLAERILLIGSADPLLKDLARRQNLRVLSQELIAPQLWSVLEPLLTFSPPPDSVPAAIEPAQMMFDSFYSPSEGVRGSDSLSRQLGYQTASSCVDLLLKSESDTGRISIIGQVLNISGNKQEMGGLPVLLVSGMKTMARTGTNQLGEFSLECGFVDEASVEIRLGEGRWVSLQLGKLNWIREGILGSDEVEGRLGGEGTA